MSFIRTATALSAAALITKLSSAQLLTFCKDNQCGDCPVAPGQAVGYPLCNIYNTETVLGDNGFQGVAGGGFQTWVDVPEPDEGCTVLIRSPAGVDQENCGVPVGMFSSGTCANVPLKQTFMMQYCCGSGDCTAAGVQRRTADGGWAFDKRSGGAGFKFYDRSGNVIEPIASGNPPEKKEKRAEAVTSTKRDSPVLAKRESCSGWNPTSDIYTKNALDFQVVAGSVNGGTTGGSIAITTERSVSTTATFEMGIADIISLGASFATTEETSSSKTVTVSVPAGSVGEMTFTAKLKCQDGTSSCDGSDKAGTICSGYMLGDDVAGTYSVAAVTKQ
ncbi:hypothetical protein N0V90_008053 [Kalmusia sp. IMI 367209]|nr:hypothetical protein N0V90_008053 [Kalmusia sp. IMI 367209]